MQPYEKLGVFYLGREMDPGSGEITERPLLYETKDLTTHAVCVGMTGSGKTGLCLSLLEEAALDKVPAILVDPKGDLGNLLLTFPELEAEDFRPWVDESDALRKGMTPDEFAQKISETWREGLAGWDQDGDRIRRFRESVDLAIYTPGSSAGLPLRLLRSFAAPPPELVADADALREKITAAATGLLVLLGIDADPVQSRELILLSNLLDHAWRAGRDLDLKQLIREVQSPPFDQVGVFDLDSFYSAKERFELAMKLNSLLASPSFAPWREGEPFEIPRLLHTPEGKPRLSILSIAHLSERERMFFVTALLNEMVSWMRTQAGTSSLRAILYMDEIFGFFPPTANPPSKTPMLTLLKQARAYGLGVVLATQNPVDLDYKGLSNTGTWFLGRLQTERDLRRVIDGLEGASASSGQALDRQKIERTLAGLKSRVFLMNNVHDDEPTLFHTRWAMSYLRGPLTKVQIETLMAEKKAQRAAAMPPAVPPGAGAKRAGATAPAARTGGAVPGSPPPPIERPLVPPGVAEIFVAAESPVTGAGHEYRAALLGSARVHYANARTGLDVWREVQLLAPLDEGAEADPWDLASAGALPQSSAPEAGIRFTAPPAAALQAKRYAAWGKKLATHLYREHPLVLWKCGAPKATSEPGESEADFRARLAVLLREERDLAHEKLRKKYATKFATLEERIRTAEQRVDKEKEQHKQQKLQTAISMGATMLGALFGRKAMSVGTVGRASTAMRGVGRVAREKGDIERAVGSLESNREKLAALEETLQEDVNALDLRYAPEEIELDELTVRPRKTDIEVRRVALTWTPWVVGADGSSRPDFTS